MSRFSLPSQIDQSLTFIVTASVVCRCYSKSNLANALVRWSAHSCPTRMQRIRPTELEARASALQCSGHSARRQFMLKHISRRCIPHSLPTWSNSLCFRASSQWERVESLTPLHQRGPTKQNQFRLDNGCMRLPARQVFDAILYASRHPSR